MSVEQCIHGTKFLKCARFMCSQTTTTPFTPSLSGLLKDDGAVQNVLSLISVLRRSERRPPNNRPRCSTLDTRAMIFVRCSLLNNTRCTFLKSLCVACRSWTCSFLSEIQDTQKLIVKAFMQGQTTP
jgi:hypothetical protein